MTVLENRTTLEYKKDIEPHIIYLFKADIAVQVEVLCGLKLIFYFER